MAARSLHQGCRYAIALLAVVGHARRTDLGHSRRRDIRERALTTVVATCYLLGVSTRRMEKLVET